VIASPRPLDELPPIHGRLVPLPGSRRTVPDLQGMASAQADSLRVSVAAGPVPRGRGRVRARQAPLPALKGLAVPRQWVVDWVPGLGDPAFGLKRLVRREGAVSDVT
jgi:hypothetical protein